MMENIFKGIRMLCFMSMSLLQLGQAYVVLCAASLADHFCFDWSFAVILDLFLQTQGPLQGLTGAPLPHSRGSSKG